MKRQNGTKTGSTPPASSASGGAFTDTPSKTSTKKAAGLPALEIQRQAKPTSEDIKRKAYEIYLGRLKSGEPGSPENDWDRAERELTRKR